MADRSFAAALNEQISNEFAAHQQYIRAAVNYESETLPRLAAFFYRQAVEERNHAMMMVQHLLDASEEVRIPDIESKINSKPSRFGSLQELMSVYEYCDREEIAVYGGGQGELGVGRQQIQYLASVFHPDTPNDVAPSGFNDPSVPDGLASSPMEPKPADAGFRWAD
jgi:hypothetical protein